MFAKNARRALTLAVLIAPLTVVPRTTADPSGPQMEAGKAGSPPAEILQAVQPQAGPRISINGVR